MLALRIRHWAVWALGLSLLAASSATTGLRSNLAGRSVSAAIAPVLEQCSDGLSHSDIELSRGQYLRLWLASATPLEARLLAPSGSTVASATLVDDGEAIVSTVATVAGTHRLEVRCTRPGFPEFWIAVDAESPALDGERIDLDRAFTEALALAGRFAARDRRLAAEQLERVVERGSSAGDTIITARALTALARLRGGLGDDRTALTLYDRALEWAGAVDPLLADALIGAARSHVRSDSPETAHALGMRALSLSGENEDIVRQARAGLAVGLSQQDSGELEQALAQHERARELFVAAGSTRGEIEALTHVGFTLSDLSREAEALTTLGEALGKAREAGDRRGEALCLMALGHAHSKLGAKQTALGHYTETEPLFSEMDDPYWGASLHGGIGFVHEELGDWERAYAQYVRSLELFEQVESLWGQSVTFTLLGRAQRALGNHSRGRAYHEAALSASERLSDPRLLAFALADMGDVSVELERTERAVDYYDRSVALSRDGGFTRHEASVLTRLARLETERRRFDVAASHLSAARSQSRRIGFQLGESRALLEQARLERAQGDIDGSRRSAEAGIALIEDLRGNVNSRRLRTSFFDSVRELQELYVDVLMELHRRDPDAGLDTAAFRASEAARARSLSEILSALENRSDVPATSRRIDEVEARLRVLAAHREIDRRNESSSDDGAESREVGRLLAELDLLKSRHSEPLTTAEAISYSPPPLADIQSELDADTSLLAYHLGDERSFLWLVTRDGIESHVLLDRETLSNRARAVYGLLAPEERAPDVSSKEYHQRQREREQEFWQKAGALSDALLAPVHAKLGNRRLVVVGDGVLHQVPFSALPTPGSEEPEPLVLHHEIVRLPSAASLPLLRARSRSRLAPPKQLAVIADPVFGADDPRHVADAASGAPLSPDEPWGLPQALRDVLLSSDARVPRLPASRQEANAILQLVPPESRLRALGFDANRALTSGGALADYRIVHFATHGILDSKHPSLSGIILSLFDASGEPRDGFLRLHELYDLDLPVDLVVLSACSTGLGKESRAEGLIGLVRGFLSSGASGVVASYWNVDDVATAELMRRFYEHMLSRAMPPAEALRKAQLSMWGDKRFRAPFYWAAFELHGQWAT